MDTKGSSGTSTPDAYHHRTSHPPIPSAWYAIIYHFIISHSYGCSISIIFQNTSTYYCCKINCMYRYIFFFSSLQLTCHPQQPEVWALPLWINTCWGDHLINQSIPDNTDMTCKWIPADPSLRLGQAHQGNLPSVDWWNPGIDLQIWIPLWEALRRTLLSKVTSHDSVLLCRGLESSPWRYRILWKVTLLQMAEDDPIKFGSSSNKP